MAKKQMPKKQPSNVNKKVDKFWQKNWAALLLVIVLLGVLAFIGVNRLIIYNQKKQFDQAEKSLDTLYADIVKNVGQPTDMKKDKSCGYSSTEGGKGRLGCAIGYKLIYPVDTSDNANRVRLSIFDTGKRLVEMTYSRNNQFLSRNSIPGEEPAFDFKCTGDISCSLSIEYHDPDDKSSNAYTQKEVVVRFSAGGSAKAEFYPVKN